MLDTDRGDEIAWNIALTPGQLAPFDVADSHTVCVASTFRPCQRVWMCPDRHGLTAEKEVRIELVRLDRHILIDDVELLDRVIITGGHLLRRSIRCHWHEYITVDIA